ncbi:Peptidoglycan lytic exotransglycosylase [Sulfidibacter corallicola]
MPLSFSRFPSLFNRATLLCTALFACLVSCGRGPAPPPPPPPPPTGTEFVRLAPQAWPDMVDGHTRESMLAALAYQMTWLERSGADRRWQFGQTTYSSEDMLASLTRFQELWLRHYGNWAALRSALQAEFDLYHWHWDGRPDILFTGYYAPVFQGSRRLEGIYRYPLYRKPADLLAIRLDLFDPKFVQPGPAMRGDRLMARLDGKRQIVPYFSRADIDQDRVLAGRNLELVYLASYWDNFVFQIQGGGFVQLPDGGYLKLDYAGKNGRPYVSVGRLLIEDGIIPRENMSMQALTAYFRDNPDDIARYCFQNESYVFYQSDGVTHRDLRPELFPHGSLGFPVTTRRSIATDKKLFPGGGLAFIRGMQHQSQGPPQPFSGFVLDQDTGGAIRENHIDVFMGAGDEAEALAGRLKDKRGEVFFLVLKKPGS